MKNLIVRLESKAGARDLALSIRELVIGGWAGRDKAAMEHHMQELEALGVKRPVTTPVYYRVAASRLTAEPLIEDAGPNGSGEVETVLFSSGGHLYVGAGSDHTDRQVETYGIAISKQVCDKPLAAAVWPFEEVAAHWDQLILRSFATIGGERLKYQEGPVAGLLPPAELIRGLTGGGALPEGTALFGGTIAAIDGIRPATQFEGELEDPVLQRCIRFGYGIKVLPIAG